MSSLRLLCAFRYTHDRSWPVHPFAAQGVHELVYIEAGDYRVDLGRGRQAQGTAGDLFVIPGDLPHRPATLRARPILVCLRWEGPRPQPGLPLHDHTADIAIGLSWLLRWMPPDQSAIETVPPALRRAMEHLLAAILHAMEASRDAESEPTDPLSATRRYLDQHLAYAHRLDDLAAQVSRSPAYLSRAFAARYGLPPLRYLQQRRLSVARDLLRGGSLSPRRVAERVGYASYEHFSRLFKRAYGICPSDARGEGDSLAILSARRK